MSYLQDFLRSLNEDYERLAVGGQECNSFLLTQRLPRMKGDINVISELILLANEDEFQELVELKARLNNLYSDAADLLSQENGNADTCDGSINVLPASSVTEETLLMLRRSGMTWAAIARMLSISRKSMCKLRKRLSIQEPFTSVSDEEPQGLLLDLLETSHPKAGAVILRGALLSQGIRVALGRVKRVLRKVDPIGSLMRKRCNIRRSYNVKNSNYLWHMDGNHKLVMFHFVIHGCVDGHSRMITFLNCSTDNTAKTPLDLFKTSVDKFGLPDRVRGDRGCENGGVADFLNEAYGENRFIFGPSVQNVRIERLWRDVNEKVTRFYKENFMYLESESLLGECNLLEIFCLHYIYLRRIRMALLQFKNAWNNHSVRTLNNQTPNQKWMVGMLQRMDELGNSPDILNNFQFEEGFTYHSQLLLFSKNYQKKF